MVCLGNICRSPLAEGIMRHKIELYNLGWEVDSCGTSGWHDGERPQDKTLESAYVNGIDMTGIRSRKFVISDFDEFDLIVVMDHQNKKNVLSLARNDDDNKKVVTLLSFDNYSDLEEVPDPYYEGGFDYVYEIIDKATDGLLSTLGKQIKNS